MPYSITTHMEDGKKCYSVITTATGNVHSKCTTLAKAKAQLRLLKDVEEMSSTKQKKDVPTINKTMNPWIEHVKKFAQKKGISYSEALKNPDVKKGYKPKTKGGAIYGDRDDDSEEENEDTFSMGKLADDMPSVAPALRKKVRAKRPPTKQAPMEAKSLEMRKKVKAKRPSTTDPKRVMERADYLKAWIESARLDGNLSQRQAKMLVGEIDEVVKEPRLSFEEKMAELLSTEKSLRVFTDDVSPDPF